MRPYVLLIDDEEAFAETHRAAFALRDVSIDVVHTWADGLALFRLCAHELVIADYQLPDSENGFRLLAAAKRDRPGTMLVLISGVLSARAGDILDGSTLIDAYYAKEPDLLDELLVHVAEADRRAQMAADWPRIAASWLKRYEITEQEISELDDSLRAEMGAR